MGKNKPLTVSQLRKKLGKQKADAKKAQEAQRRKARRDKKIKQLHAAVGAEPSSPAVSELAPSSIPKSSPMTSVRRDPDLIRDGDDFLLGSGGGKNKRKSKPQVEPAAAPAAEADADALSVTSSGSELFAPCHSERRRDAGTDSEVDSDNSFSSDFGGIGAGAGAGAGAGGHGISDSGEDTPDFKYAYAEAKRLSIGLFCIARRNCPTIQKRLDKVIQFQLLAAEVLPHYQCLMTELGSQFKMKHYKEFAESLGSKCLMSDVNLREGVSRNGYTNDGAYELEERDSVFTKVECGFDYIKKEDLPEFGKVLKLNKKSIPREQKIAELAYQLIYEFQADETLPGKIDLKVDFPIQVVQSYIANKVNPDEYEFDEAKAQRLLNAIKRHWVALDFSSVELTTICSDKDPVFTPERRGRRASSFDPAPGSSHSSDSRSTSRSPVPDFSFVVGDFPTPCSQVGSDGGAPATPEF